MTIIENYTGNLIEAFLDASDKRITDMAHGCNNFHSMGAGIAAEVAKKIPKAYQADKDTLYGSDSKLGDFSYAHIVQGRCFNLYTQHRPGKDARLDAVVEAFRNLNNFLKDEKGTIVGIPLIGCGIGGLSWIDVEKSINDNTPNLNIAVFRFVP